MRIENKKYFVEPVNSSKANKFTAYYHYSGVGFKKAKLNLGVFDKETELLVGVMQWGCSAQESIRLDRYVKEPITTDEYYELNRFCMADSEGHNSESQAISLGIKWIKANHSHIKLLVSYAGRKEGNVGYIYQATNWEYLGYFISPGFWLIDGVERHQITLWYYYTRSDYTDLPFTDALCKMYDQVIQTWTKQFIYVQRLDKSLTLASDILPYPKITDGAITTKTKIYKDTNQTFITKKIGSKPIYYYDPKELLFTRRKLIRDGAIRSNKDYQIVSYDAYGHLIEARDNMSSYQPEYLPSGIKKSCEQGKFYKDRYFIRILRDEAPPEEIDVPVYCIIDEIPFITLSDASKYLGVSRQAVSASHQRYGKVINGKNVIWIK